MTEIAWSRGPRHRPRSPFPVDQMASRSGLLDTCKTHQADTSTRRSSPSCIDRDQLALPHLRRWLPPQVRQRAVAHHRRRRVRCQVQHVAVNEPGHVQVVSDASTAFDEQLDDPTRTKFSEDVVEITGQLDRRVRLASFGAFPSTTRMGCRPTVFVANSNGQLWIVGPNRPRTNEHGIRSGPEAIRVISGRLARDPTAGPVGGAANNARRGAPPSSRRTTADRTGGAWDEATSCSVTSASPIPMLTSMPASRRACTPRPQTKGSGSSTPITTRATPATMMASVHGGVRPWWLQGWSRL